VSGGGTATGSDAVSSGSKAATIAAATAPRPWSDPSRDTWASVDDHRVAVLPSLAELRKAQAYLLVYERVDFSD
jgi:hypothetical protein